MISVHADIARLNNRMLQPSYWNLKLSGTSAARNTANLVDVSLPLIPAGAAAESIHSEIAIFFLEKIYIRRDTIDEKNQNT
jgi:hypothetical protein